MKSLLAAVLLLASVAAHADESRSFNSIIRAQSDTAGAPSDASGNAAAACAAPTSVIDMILAFFGHGGCDEVATLSNIDTALQLGPR